MQGDSVRAGRSFAVFAAQDDANLLPVGAREVDEAGVDVH